MSQTLMWGIPEAEIQVLPLSLSAVTHSSTTLLQSHGHAREALYFLNTQVTNIFFAHHDNLILLTSPPD